MTAKNWQYIAVALLAGVLTWGSFSLGFFFGFESFVEDLLFSPKPVSEKIVILAIDNESINKIGQWPWPREVFARAFGELAKNPPRAAGLDVMLAEPSRRGSEDDAKLAQVLNQTKYPVILPEEASPLLLEKESSPRAERALKPLSAFAEAESVTLGHVNLILDADGVVRSFPPRVSFDEDAEAAEAVETKSVRSFAYELARQAGEALPDEESLKDVERIVFSGPSGSVRQVPFWRLLDKDSQPDLKDKIVLIGATAPDLHDEKPTPFGRGSQMAGVEIQANVLNMLIRGWRLRSLDQSLMSFWLLAAALLPSLFFVVFKRSVPPVLASAATGLGHILAAAFLFEKGFAANIVHLNISWILSTASLFGWRYFAVEKEKRQIRNLFSKYVSQDVLEEILRDPSRVKLGGEEKEITVFFSDIRGFTTLSEKTTPSQLVEALNLYFTAMSREILENNGVLDKYIGDAIMAFWGAPVGDDDQADHALRAAIGMLSKLSELNRELKARWDVEINIGIGIHTGPAVIGNIGSDQRFDYTVIGDTVNVASRLEGLNKEHKTRIIISKTTRNRTKGNYNFKPLGAVTVKGRQEPLDIYTIEGYA